MFLIQISKKNLKIIQQSRKQLTTDIKVYIDERLPEEYEKCLADPIQS